MKVIEVLSVESSENNHATTHKASAVSSARLRLVDDSSSHSQSLHGVSFGVDDEHIVEVAAETASKDVYFSIKDDRRVAPPAQERRGSFKFPLHPFEFLVRFTGQEGLQVEGIDISKAAILSMAACHNKELVIDDARRMEPASTGADLIFVELDFSPPFVLEVEDPEIIQIGESFSSEDDQVGIGQLGHMVCAFPGRGFVLLGNDLSPDFRFPVEHADSIETLLVGASSSEDDDLVGVGVVVDGAVGAERGALSGGDDLLPCFLGGVVGPEVVHVVGVCMRKELPAYPPKKRT